MSCDPSVPGNQDREEFAGDGLDLTLTLTANGTPVDVSTWTWLGQIRDAYGNLVASFTFDTSDAVNGVVVASVLLDLEPGYYTYEIQYTSDKPHTLIGGKLLIKSDTAH